MKFKVGDPVWAGSASPGSTATDLGVPIKELPAVVLGAYEINDRGQSYYINLIGYQPPRAQGWTWRENNLRPRRDDYQQHEGLGARDQFTKPLADDPITVKERV
jgi:hypothetical protein